MLVVQSAVILANGSTASDVMARGVAVDAAVASCGDVSASWRAAGAARPTSPMLALKAHKERKQLMILNQALLVLTCARTAAHDVER